MPENAPPGVTIRAATADELDRATELRGVMAREMGRTWDDDHPEWRAHFAAYWRAKQIAGETQCYVAERHGAIVASVLASLCDDYRRTALDQPRGYVNGLYVPPELRRQGVGRRLMAAALEWLRARGCESVRLHASDAGRPLYASLGFKEGDEMVLHL
jgi:ribosomal protein S18 acetylase RimI-like enzyme